MSGLASNLFGFNGNNNGTEDAFKNSGEGGEDFKDKEFNRYVQIPKGKLAPCSGNNGTQDAFNHSSLGKQDFRKATFNFYVIHTKACNCNNGTEKNSGEGGQDFKNAEFKTNLRVERDALIDFFTNMAAAWRRVIGTEDSFKTSRAGVQEFKDAEFNTGVQVAKGRLTPCRINNGTKNAFNKSSYAEQDFKGATFNIYVLVAEGTHAPCSCNNGTEDTFKTLAAAVQNAFNNSGLGKQDFGSAKFNTGARFN